MEIERDVSVSCLLVNNYELFDDVYFLRLETGLTTFTNPSSTPKYSYMAKDVEITSQPYLVSLLSLDHRNIGIEYAITDTGTFSSGKRKFKIDYYHNIWDNLLKTRTTVREFQVAMAALTKYTCQDGYYMTSSGATPTCSRKEYIYITTRMPLVLRYLHHFRDIMLDLRILEGHCHSVYHLSRRVLVGWYQPHLRDLRLLLRDMHWPQHQRLRHLLR